MNTQPTDNPEKSCFLVCGLGRLGQHCVSVLKEFDVIVNAINVTDNAYWEIPELPDLIDLLVIGDCRQPKVLQQAKIQQYRAVLIVTSDERVNIETAFTIRSLNPHARLVVRSDQGSLNELLQEHLGNYIAFEASQLPATAFALAALDGEIQGFFTLENSIVRVINVQIHDKHRWCNIRLLHELNSFTQRILSHNGHTTADVDFYQWEPDARILAGDSVTYIEVTSQITSVSSKAVTANGGKFWQEIIANLHWVRLKPRLQQIWQSIEQHQTQQVAILSAAVMVSLFVLGTVLYKLQYPDISIQDALNVSLVLAIGGYDNLFGQLKLPFPVPWWLHLYSISLTVGGTVFVGIFYAMLTERVLSTRLQLLKRRPPLPRQDHVVVIGLGRLGKRVAKLLQELKQPLVAIHNTSLDADVLPVMPLVIDHPIPGLMKVNLATAKSVMVLTDDEVANLEIGLQTKTINSVANLVIRTFDPLFTKNISRLLPQARILQAYALAAEAFAGAAFGENIIALFRLNNQTILVTEYQIEAQDTLNDLLLADVAYGYGVVPILHQKANREPAKFMPSDDIKLKVGDRLVVLATIRGLQQIEQSLRNPRTWLVRIEKALTSAAAFDGGMVIARISDCDIGTARSLMNQLPATLPYSLYKHQAQRLVRELSKVQVFAHLIPASGSI